jgi:hypothetical protein
MELSNGETCTVTKEDLKSVGLEDVTCSDDEEFDEGWKAFTYCAYVESTIFDEDEVSTFDSRLIDESYENGWINEPEEATAEELETDGKELMCIATYQGSFVYVANGGDLEDDEATSKAMCQSSIDLTCSVKCAMQGSGAKEQSGVTQGQAEGAAEEAAAEIDQDEAEDAAMQLGAAFTESMNNAWGTQGWSLEDCDDVDEEPDCGC